MEDAVPADAPPSCPGPAPAPARRRSRPWVMPLVWMTLGSMILVVIGLVGLVVLYWPQTTTVEVFRQPESVEYSDGIRHSAILRRDHTLASALGIEGDSYEVLFGVADEGRVSVSYGHTVDLAATGSDPSDLTVEWEPHGAWIDYASGHRVFVPAEAFLGGR